MKRIFLIIILCLLLCGCNNKEINTIMDNDAIKEIMENAKYIIIDVRTKEEYNNGHIVDAINIPYDEINENIDIEKSNIIFVYCMSGNRSKIAFNNLKKLGYTVYDLGSYDEIDLPKK